ncbi:hypothetical protein ZOSMA_347G00070 [Zostera marina]|uniref:RING-type E3 ubiquitin transferase n=1 Tax=Zostera marina TaxID=29655 RepID=A0A0K9P788_ZOSMR|nr:hypothetical protein ZOSMA_347G00070 [Zostera marina]
MGSSFSGTSKPEKEIASPCKRKCQELEGGDKGKKARPSIGTSKPEKEIASLGKRNCQEFEGVEKGKIGHSSPRTSKSEKKIVSLAIEGADKQPKEVLDCIIDSDLLDCMVCYEPLIGSIFQCKNGYIICQTCCKKINRRCPTCKCTIGVRNLVLEHIINSIQVRCPYATNGCAEVFSFCDRQSHAKNCHHAPLSCPFESCSFDGCNAELFNHIKDAHVYTEACTGEYVNLAIKIGKQNCLLGDDCSIYLIVVKKQSSAFCISVLCFSSLTDYKIKLYGNGNSKLSFSGNVPTIWEIVDAHALSSLDNNMLVPYTMYDVDTHHIDLQICFI